MLMDLVVLHMHSTCADAQELKVLLTALQELEHPPQLVLASCVSLLQDQETGLQCCFDCESKLSPLITG